MLIAIYRNDSLDRSIQKAMGLLGRLLEEAEKGERKGSVIEILILQALANESKGDIPPALESFERALTLAEPECYIQIFVDEGNPMKRLITQAIAKGIKPGYLDQLMAAFENIP
jgi:LuxR family maltose regulon positive regulatory protein